MCVFAAFDFHEVRCEQCYFSIYSRSLLLL